MFPLIIACLLAAVEYKSRRDTLQISPVIFTNRNVLSNLITAIDKTKILLRLLFCYLITGLPDFFYFFWFVREE